MNILHCDLNNFYASVEQSLDDNLKNLPIAVTGNPETRTGIILAKNYLAKEMGVQTGEVIWQARQKCPNLVCVPPHYEQYVHFSKRVRDIYAQYTDKIEPFGMDECWLDISGCSIFGTPEQIANKIREQVKAETGLTISVGVSFNKVFAKLGSDLKKPDAVTVISRQNYKQVVWKLPVCDMIFIGRQMGKQLNSMGIFTIGDLANTSTLAMKKRFGVVGEKLIAYARGEDDDEVRLYAKPHEVKSIGHGITALRDMRTYEDADIVICFLSDLVATRLRKNGFIGDVVHLDIRRNDLSHESKQCHVNSTNTASDIYNTATRLLRCIWHANFDMPLRSLSVSVTKLSAAENGVQMTIFDEVDTKTHKLECCIDQIRRKFGYSSIKKACLVNNDLVTDRSLGEEDFLPFER